MIINTELLRKKLDERYIKSLESFDKIAINNSEKTAIYLINKLEAEQIKILELIDKIETLYNKTI